MEFQYNCKKTGQVIDVDTSKLPDSSRDYALGRGLREYFDNYHAGVTIKEHGVEKCAELVAPMVTEAYERLMAGDIPGSRAPADPAKRKAQVTAFLKNLSKDDLRQLLAEVRAA